MREVLMSVVSLAPKPTVDDQIKRGVVELLRELLADAEAGKIESLLVIGNCVGSGWFDRRSGTLAFAETVGQLEVVKQTWISSYLAEQAGHSPESA